MPNFRVPLENLRELFAVACLSTVTACGGGASPPPSPTPPSPAPASVMLNGSAYGATALAGATVKLVDANGKTASATTATDGSFSVDISTLTAPLLLSVAAGSTTYYGFAASGELTANVNPFTSNAVQTYYAATGTTAAAAWQSSAVPDIDAAVAIMNLVVDDVQDILGHAGVSLPSTLNPAIAKVPSDGTGFAQVLGRTTLSSDALTLAVDDGKGATAGASVTKITFLPAAASSGSTGIVNVTLAQNGIGNSQTLNLCLNDKAGTLIPGTRQYDCVQSFLILPSNRIAVGFGGTVDFQQSPNNVSFYSPTILGLDASGNYTVVRGGQMTFSITNPSVIRLSSVVLPDNTSINWPQVTAQDIGSSSLTVTDNLTKASASVEIDGVVPKIIPNPVTIESPDLSATIHFADPVTGQPVEVLGNAVPTAGFYTLVADDQAIATVSPFYGDLTGTQVYAGTAGQTKIRMTAVFGSAGTQTIEACVSTTTSSTCSGTPTSLTLTASSDSIFVDGASASLQLTANETDGNGNTVNVGALSYSSNNAEVSVSSTGLVTAAADTVGSVTIVATDAANNLSGSITLNVLTTDLTPSQVALSLSDVTCTVDQSSNVPYTISANGGYAITPQTGSLLNVYPTLFIEVMYAPVDASGDNMISLVGTVGDGFNCTGTYGGDECPAPVASTSSAVATGNWTVGPVAAWIPSGSKPISLWVEWVDITNFTNPQTATHMAQLATLTCQ